MRGRYIMKDDLKMFGAEALYLSASVIVAGLASLLQTVGRTFEGRYSGFFMSGDEYSYSILFYLLGMVIFVSFMVMGYRYFLRKRISNLYRTGMSAKILFAVISAVFALLMIAAIVICLYLRVGMTDNMRPLWMENTTIFGWPIFSLIFMIFVELIESNA